MNDHRTRTDRNLAAGAWFGWWVPSCGCGWIGQVYMARADAQQEVRRHRMVARKRGGVRT